MTRRHYEAVARVLKAQLDAGKDVETLLAVAVGFADVAAEDNSRFDRSRFLKACGLASWADVIYGR